MKKILLLILISLTLFSCTSISKKERVKKEIITNLKETTGDNFYFIYGLDREYSIATNVKYRGIIYSDRLEKLQWPEGLEIGLDSLSSQNTSYIHSNYKGLLRQIEIDSMAENRAREIFGEKINLYNDGTTTEHMYKNIIQNKSKNKEFEKKSGYYSTIVNYFVDDLDKLDNEDIKKKTFELAKFIYDDMNYVTALQVYVRDNKYFEDYNLVYYSIYKPFRTREDIVEILNKIRAKEKISEEDKVALVKVFNKGGLDYNKSITAGFSIRFKDISELPIDRKKIMYEGLIKNGRYGD